MAHELQLTTDEEDVTLPIGQHPDGVLTFEGGTAAVDEESVARVIDETYPNIEYVDGADDGAASDDADSEPDQEDDDVVAESPFDPTEKTVGELEELLEEGDYSAAELDAIAAAEEAGEDRSTAQDAIDAARE